jgi:Na+/melibiose symporter-like transporter
MPGNIYNNQIISSVCNILFYIISYQIFTKVGFKKSFFIGFVMAMLGSILLIFVKTHGDIVAVFILLARVGNCFIFNIAYLSFAFLFPPIFS